MTHSTGIPVSDELDKIFGAARSSDNDSVRIIKAEIRDDQVQFSRKQSNSGDQQADLDSVRELLEKSMPCYVLFRIDGLSLDGQSRWIFVSYVPDSSPVKLKMLYAGTRDICKKQLGYNLFIDEIQASEIHEISWSAYQLHKKSRYSDAPLTAAEVQYREEATAVIDPGHTREYVHSVKFPMSKDAVNSVASLGKGEIQLVQLLVDPTKETIELGLKTKMSMDKLPASIPDSEPRFSLFAYQHVHEGSKIVSTVFIYSCPSAAPVKLKMLYSTVKAPALSAIESAGVKVDQKVEITSSDELTAEMLNEYIHPPVVEQKKVFSKPARPGKGGARMTSRTPNK